MPAPKISLSEISQVINLDEFGLSIETKAEKEALAERIIDYMVKRVEGGTGMSFSGDTGRPVNLSSKPYSPAYKSSLAFKAWGKKPGTVNMKLTGDMLGLIDVISTEGNKIKIGLTDDLQIKKAYNHNTGDTVPKRPFFGINKTEMREIAREFKKTQKE